MHSYVHIVALGLTIAQRTCDPCASSTDFHTTKLVDVNWTVTVIVKLRLPPKLLMRRHRIFLRQRTVVRRVLLIPPHLAPPLQHGGDPIAFFRQKTTVKPVNSQIWCWAVTVGQILLEIPNTTSSESYNSVGLQALYCRAVCLIFTVFVTAVEALKCSKIEKRVRIIF